MDNPWKTLDSRTVYDNPWIRIQEDRVINPAGGEGIYGLVKFKNLAVGVIPLDASGHTWLVGQYRYALDAYSWEIPMGGVPLGEAALAGAQRELREETGLQAKRWDELMALHTTNSVTDERGVVFVARELTQGATAFEDTEDLQVKRMPFDEALTWALDGRITDAISVAALLKLAMQRHHYGL